VDKSPKSKKKHDLGDVLAISAMESTSDAENMSSVIHAIVKEVNASSKSRVWENHKHGSVGVA